MNLPDMLEAKKRIKYDVKIIDYKSDKSNYGKGKKVFIRTYGCQMNEHDTEKIKGILYENGYTFTDILEESDIVILNTCAIRENAHNKVFGFLGRIKHLKERKPNVLVGLCGCMAQERNVVDEIIDKHKYIDFVFGTHNICDIMTLIKKCNKGQEICVYSKYGDIYESIPHYRNSDITAYVDIMLGCNNFCTYCIVPYTRGGARSRNKESIIKEVIELKENGYKEVVLLGQNVDAYGKDIYTDYDLSNLLYDISETKIDRIRFLTSYPSDFNENMINAINKLDNVMPHIHLPVQSGSNKILKLMGRRYTREDYLNLYNLIRKKIKKVSITTDIIVGFPGETNRDFMETLDLVKECKFDSAFTFAYSVRENTPAKFLKNQLNEDTKLGRLNELNKLVNKYSYYNNKKYLNKIVKVLVISKSDKYNKVMGYTENMKLVNIEGKEDLIGNIIEVKIIDAKSFSLDGKVI